MGHGIEYVTESRIHKFNSPPNIMTVGSKYTFGNDNMVSPIAADIEYLYFLPEHIDYYKYWIYANTLYHDILEIQENNPFSYWETNWMMVGLVLEVKEKLMSWKN